MGLESSTPPDSVPEPSGTSSSSDGQRSFASTGPSGHRSRMRDRVLSRGAAALADYEILEMLLFLGIPRRDTKPLAKSLINRFGSLVGVINAPVTVLRDVPLNDASIAALKMSGYAAQRLADAETRTRPQLGNWEALLAYFDTAMQGAVPGQLRVLFLDNRNRLLGDESVAEGGDGVSRSGPKIVAASIVRRALVLHATALIVVRLCLPSETPAKRVVSDEALGRELARSGALLAVTVHDVFALKGGEWAGLRQLGKL